MGNSPTIVWFRCDLRLDDHPALAAAVERGGPVIPAFIWAPEEEGSWPPGGASRWWLHQSLRSLQASLESIGSRLILRRGPSLRCLQVLVGETGANSVLWSRRYEPAAQERDAAVEATLRADGLAVETFNASLLFEPWEVSTQQGGPFQVFTSFWKACLARPQPPLPQAAPQRLSAPKCWPESLPVAALALEPAVDWAGGLRAAWTPGEAGARTRLRRFLAQAVARYHEDRDRPDLEGVSFLSPHLHFGEISPRRVWHEVRTEGGGLKTGSQVGHSLSPQRSVLSTRQGAESFLRELGWREFGYHLLHHFPRTPDQPLREAFAAFPWESDAASLAAWQKGRTGYPLVDAGMRQLWQTGWMHNRVRMVAASFLVKDLLIPWQQGARWFWDTLVDADLANNTLGWQWTAGCGADAAPYFRVFNPVSQGQKFDPLGDYVRRWVPELAALPAEWVHQPWQAPVAVLTQAGVELGVTYPYPLVDHSEARQRALAAYERIKGNARA